MPSSSVRLISCFNQSVQEVALFCQLILLLWLLLTLWRRSFRGGVVYLCFGTQVLLQGFGRSPFVLPLVCCAFEAIGRISKTAA